MQVRHESQHKMFFVSGLINYLFDYIWFDF